MVMMIKAIYPPLTCEVSPKIKSVCDSGIRMWNERVSDSTGIKEGMPPVFLREFGAPLCWLLQKVSLERL